MAGGSRVGGGEAGEASSSGLAKAVLAQSNALTPLVGQIANMGSGPLGEIEASSRTSSAQGNFLLSVLQSMSRRMCLPDQQNSARRQEELRQLAMWGGSSAMESAETSATSCGRRR